MAVSTDFINTGGGKLYIEPFVDGVLNGKRTYFGITENVNLTTEVSYLEHKNTETSVTKTDKKLQKSVGATLSFATAEISIPMLARAYGGKITQKVQTAQVATAVTLASVSIGAFYEIGFYKITTLVVKDSTDATTYVEGTDYSVDAGSGIIEILEGTTIVDGSALNLTVTADAYTGSLMAGLKGDALEARLVFISDPLAGKRFKYTFKKVSINASGDFGLKGEDFAILNFEGSALADDTVTDATLSDYFDMEEIPE